MATTQISDVIVPEIYEDYTAVNGPEKTAFAQSGIAVENEALKGLANSGGRIIELPFWNDLDASVEPNYSTDNPADVATPEKVTAGEMVARKAFVNHGLSSADLAGELAGSSPMQQVRNRFGVYWQRQFQRRLIASMNGFLACNVAENDSDMINDIAADENTGVSETTLFSRKAFTGAAFTSGDHFDDYAAIAVHSMVYKKMVDNEDIEYIKDSEGNMMIPTFLGRRVIVDDGMPYTPGQGSNAPKYTSILFGPGAIGYGTGKPKKPVALVRDENKGNGGGIETLWERNIWIIHPFGSKFTSDSVAAESATLAELGTAENWKRVVERKNIPLAFLITNG